MKKRKKQKICTVCQRRQREADSASKREGVEEQEKKRKKRVKKKKNMGAKYINIKYIYIETEKWDVLYCVFAFDNNKANKLRLKNTQLATPPIHSLSPYHAQVLPNVLFKKKNIPRILQNNLTRILNAFTFLSYILPEFPIPHTHTHTQTDGRTDIHTHTHTALSLY